MAPKTTCRIFSVVIFFLLISACARKPIFAPVPIEGAPGEKLFQLAEMEFQAREYKRAVELYQDYLNLYPNSPIAPSALLKISTIYMAQREYDNARDICLQMLETYPESQFVPEARITILTTYYHEGAYNILLEHADGIDDNSIPRTILIRKYTLTGDALLALGSFPESGRAYLKIYEKTDGDEQKKIIQKLDTAASGMTSDELAATLSLIENHFLKGHFKYLLGLKYAKNENYENAVQILADFAEEFPNHENAEEARLLINNFSEMSEYDRTAIGCILPLSGRYETFGKRALKGIELALMKFSAENPESEIKLVIKDSGGEPDKAALAVSELADKKVAAIIGPIITAETAAMEAQARQIPIITLTQKEGITDTGDYVFRNFLTPEMQMQTMISFAMGNLGLKKFAILYPNEKYGLKFMNLFWDKVLSSGGEVVGVESYDSTQADFASPIKKLVGLYYKVPEELKIPDETMQQPDLFMSEALILNEETFEKPKESKEPEAIVDFDAIFIPDGPEKAVLILPQLTYHDVIDVYLLGTNLWHSDKLIREARQHAQGSILPEIFFSESKNRIVMEFVKNFQETYGGKPEFIEALAFDTALILLQTINNKELHFRASIKNRLLNMEDFTGVTGQTSFNLNGEADKKLFMLQIYGQKFTELEYW